MASNRDLRRVTISGANSLPARRQRTSSLKDSTQEDRQMELQETVRLRHRDRPQKKERDREFSKRRRVEKSEVQQRSTGCGESYRENDSIESSVEEYYEEEEETKIHQRNPMNQLSPTSSSLSNSRRGFRILRSSPMLRGVADDIFGVPIPRRARSISAKRLHASVGLREDLSNRRFSPARASLMSSGGTSSSSSGASMNKTMKSIEPRTRVLRSASNCIRSSVIQDDIEIEVAEALFDLMKQSRSQSQSSQTREKVDRDSRNIDELKRLTTVGGKDDENNGFAVQNELSLNVNAETVMVDSMEGQKKEERVGKEKFVEDPAQELLYGDRSVNKRKAVSPKESESPSCVKVQNPTVTKADDAAIVIEAKKEAKPEIDLMASPPLPSSAGKDHLADVAIFPKVITQDVQKNSMEKSENRSDGPVAVAFQTQEEKVGVLRGDQLPDLDSEKRRHDALSASDCATQQLWGWKERKHQLTTSLFPIPIGMSNWPGLLPHPGYMPPLQAVFPIDGSAGSSMTIRPPPFKLSQPRPKRCTTHQYIARNIEIHHRLLKKSLSSGPTGPATLYGSTPLNLKCTSSTQKFIPGNTLGDCQGEQNLATISGGSGKDKISGVAPAFSAGASESVGQQVPQQGPANNFWHCPGFMFPLRHHQTSMVAPANSSGPPPSASAVGNASFICNSAGTPFVNSALPAGVAAVSVSHAMFPSIETAPYMALLQKSGCPIPISTNISMHPFEGGSPTVPYINSSFDVHNQQQLFLPHAPVQSAYETTSTFSGSSLHGHSQGQQHTSKIRDEKIPTSASTHLPQPPQQSHSSSKYNTIIAEGLMSHSLRPNDGRTGSFPVLPMNIAVTQPLSIGGGAVGIKCSDPRQQGTEGRVDLVPQAFGTPFLPNPSANPTINFSSMAQNCAIFQTLSDKGRNGTHREPAFQEAQQKNFQTSEGKSPTSGGQPFNYSKSDCSDMSAFSTKGTAKFDSITHSISFLPSSLAGGQPFQSSSFVLSSGVSATIPNFQQHPHQQQLVQLQKLHLQQMQLNGIAQDKPSTPNSIPRSFIGNFFPNINPVFTPVSVQTNSSSFPVASEGSCQLASSALGNIPQLKSSQGQTNATSGNRLVSAAPSQGQQVLVKNQTASSLMTGLPINSSISKSVGGCVRTSPTVGKAVSTISALPSSETEVPPKGPSQKSSPACGRNMPSILSATPGQLSELKY